MFQEEDEQCRRDSFTKFTRFENECAKLPLKVWDREDCRIEIIASDFVENECYKNAQNEK